MDREKFVVYSVMRDGEVLAANAVSSQVQLDSGEVDDLAAMLSSGHACHVLPPGWDSYFPGRGHCFVVNPSQLELPVPRKANGEVPFAVVLRFDPGHWSEAHDRLSEAYGLSDVEHRLAMEMSETGTVASFEDAGGVGSATARNALTRLRRKFGTPNLAGTVTHILEFLFEAPDERESIDDAGLALVLGIAPRRFHVASLLVSGMSRTEASTHTGHSVALVKAELSLLYEMFEVQSAAELAAIVGQAKIVADEALALSVRQPRLREWGRHEVLERPDGRRVGYSLFGRPGTPLVHITHSNITCRHPPTRLVARLVQGGRQVLTIDRPGFGETSPPPARDMDTQVDCATEDLVAVLEAEGLETFTLLARSSGQMAVAYRRLIPDRIDRVIIINGLPPAALTERERGPLGALKRRFIRNPASIRLLIGMLLKLATIERIKASARRSMSGSVPDMAALDDPLVMEDYLAACLPFKKTLDGYTLEVSAWARGWEPQPSEDGEGWEILMGSHYVLHDPQIAVAHLRKVLPKAKIRMVRDGGTMLAWSHPDLIADTVLAAG